MEQPSLSIFLAWYLLLLLRVSLKWKIVFPHKILTKIFIQLSLKAAWLIMKLSAADAHPVRHERNESAHRKATRAPLTCMGVGGSTCLGKRAAGSKSAFLDSSGQLLDLLGYVMKQSPDSALSFELSFSLANRNYRSQIQCQCWYWVRAMVNNPRSSGSQHMIVYLLNEKCVRITLHCETQPCNKGTWWKVGVTKQFVLPSCLDNMNIYAYK